MRIGLWPAKPTEVKLQSMFRDPQLAGRHAAYNIRLIPQLGYIVSTRLLVYTYGTTPRCTWRFPARRGVQASRCQRSGGNAASSVGRQLPKQKPGTRPGSKSFVAEGDLQPAAAGIAVATDV